MDHAHLVTLRQSHPAWRLLRADNAPLIAGFLHRAFIAPNARGIRHAELLAALDDYLFHLREVHGEGLYPKAAAAYLEDWAQPDSAFLRKYYPATDDEAEWDLTPAAEKAITWLESLQERAFVGTESRLLTVFELLRALAFATETDTAARIAELERQRTEISAEMARLAALPAGTATIDATLVRERFYEIEETARRLLGDFRQIEANFRELDRITRERIALSERPKAELLAEIFGEQDAISVSDQGKSFRAFWAFLMSPARQEELQALLAKVADLPELASEVAESPLPRLKFNLIDAGEKVQRSSAQLVEQLRRFLDSRVWLENRRIATLIRQIEQHAVALKAAPPAEPAFASLPGVKADIELPLARPLFTPPTQLALDDTIPPPAIVDLDASALFERPYVDLIRLEQQVNALLETRPQVSVGELVAHFPVCDGVAELVGYLQLAADDERALIDAAATETLDYATRDGTARRVTLPLTIFTR